MNNNNFGMLMRLERKRRNMSQGDLADALNISKAHVSALETGKNKPSFELLEELMKILDLSFHEIEVNSEQETSERLEINYLLDRIEPERYGSILERIKIMEKLDDEKMELSLKILALLINQKK